MVHYWLLVAIRSAHQTLAFIGKSRGGVVFDIIAVVLTVFALYRKHGWREMKKKIWETLGEGVVIALGAGVLVFLWEFVNVPQEMQADSAAQIQSERILTQASDINLSDCKGRLNVAQNQAGLLGQQRDSLQQTLLSQQGQLNAQQGTINSCVVSLGKMNPVLNERFDVVTVPVYRTEQKDQSGNLITLNLFALVILTNAKADPVGVLECGNAFRLLGPPAINMQAGAGIIANSEPKALSDREYQIRVSNTGAEWTESNPIYVAAYSQSYNLGRCTFKPQ